MSLFNYGDSIVAGERGGMLGKGGLITKSNGKNRSDNFLVVFPYIFGKKYVILRVK